MQNKNGTIFSVVIVIVVVLVLWAFVAFNNKDNLPIVENNVSTSTIEIIATSTDIAGTSTTPTTSISQDKPMDTFAKCVASQDFTMYGAEWCSHCQAQKKLFGNSFKYIKYVECPDNIKLCTDKGVNGYPTWIDANGKKYEGEQELKDIAQITGCVLPQ